MNAPRMKLDLGGGRGHIYFTRRALTAIWSAIAAGAIWLYHQQQGLWACQAQNTAQEVQIKELQRRLNMHTGVAENGAQSADGGNQ